ncbi:MAG: ParB N-terminal domain-containing protein [Pseudomonadota bacterium]
MAKRKRLTPANPAFLDDTQSAAPPPGAVRRAPIADVAADAAATSALRDVSAAMEDARETGRLVARIPLDQIKMDYLVRDRVSVGDTEMDALVTSIRDRGQQTPVEVVELAPGQYGLISGWRRCQALRRVAEDSGEPAHALALLRRPEMASDAYLAMVEENEIRVGLSYFERARIALKAAEQGVFEDTEQALRGLFGTASRPKRSKIRSFVGIVQALDGVLAHPHRIGERQGLLLAKRLDDDPAFVRDLGRALSMGSDRSAEVEQGILSDLLARGPKALEPDKTVSKKAESPAHEVRPGLMAQVDQNSGALRLWGDRMTPALRDRLLEWLKRQG